MPDATPLPFVRGLRRDTRGANLVEYLILVGLIAVVVLAGLRRFGKQADAKVAAQADCITALACNGGGSGNLAAAAGLPALQTAAQQVKAGATPVPAPAPTPTPSPAPATPALPPPPAESKGFWGGALDVGKGFVVDGLWGTVTGIGHMVAHPIDTVQGLGHAVAHPIDTGSAIVGSVEKAWNENPQRVIGAGIFEVVTLPVAALKATKAAKLSKLTKVAQIAEEAEKAGEVAKIVRTAERTEEVAEVAKLARRAEEVAAARRWGRELAESAPKGDAAELAAEAAKYQKRQDEVRKAYEMVMKGEAEPPPGVTRERLALAVEGDASGRRIPLNFKDEAQFDRFQKELGDILASEGIDDATIKQVGSATKGFKGNPKKPGPFDPDGKVNPAAYWSPSSDLDFAVFSDQALAQARAAGAKANPNVVVGGKYTVLKNGGGVANTPLGQKLEAFAQKWNREFYGDAATRPGFEGIDFKVNLVNEPFPNAPTIVAPKGGVRGPK